jgi:hypothetical protein
MTWLRLLLILSQAVLKFATLLQEQGLIAEGELKGATATMELTNAALRKAMEARRRVAAGGGDAGTGNGGVQPPDPYLRDD